MQFVVTSVRKVLYCVGIVCDGVRKVSDGDFTLKILLQNFSFCYKIFITKFCITKFPLQNVCYQICVKKFALQSSVTIWFTKFAVQNLRYKICSTKFALKNLSYKI